MTEEVKMDKTITDTEAKGYSDVVAAPKVSKAPEMLPPIVPTRMTRIEYMDNDGRPHQRREDAMLENIRLELRKFVTFWWNDGTGAGNLVALFIKHRQTIISMLTPPRDGAADRQAAMMWANSNGTVPEPEPKPVRSARLMPGEDDEDETDDNERRVYTREDVLRAFNSGVAFGAVTPPVADALRKDH